MASLNQSSILTSLASINGLNAAMHMYTDQLEGVMYAWQLLAAMNPSLLIIGDL